MTRRLSKSIIQTILTQIPTQFFGIISGIFITRIISTESRGVYAVLIANASLFLTLFGFSMVTAIIYFLASKKLKLSQVFALNLLTFLVMMLLSGITIAILHFTHHIDILFLDAFSKQIFIWFFLYLALLFINSTFSAVFQAHKMFHIVNRVSLFNSIFNILLYGLLFLLYQFQLYPISLNSILLISVFVLILNFFQWNFHFTKHFDYKVDFKIDYKTHLRELVHYLGLAHLSNIISFFNGRVVLWVLAYYLDNFQIGIFSISLGLSQILSFISLPLSQVLLPYLSSENQEDRNRLFIVFSKMHFSIMVLMSLFGVVIAPYVIPVLYGAQYAESVIPFFIMILGFVFNSQTRIISSYMFSSNKVVINLYGTIVGFVSTIFFYFVLIQKYGIIGAAISTTLTYSAIFLFTYLILIKSLKKYGRNYLFLTRSDVLLIRQRLQSKSKK